MGKGDRRTRRGKIFRGTFGKRRPRLKTIKKATTGAASDATSQEASTAQAEA